MSDTVFNLFVDINHWEHGNSWESSASEWKHEAGEKMIQDDSRRRPFVRSMDFYGEEDADADGPRTRGSRE